MVKNTSDSPYDNDPRLRCVRQTDKPVGDVARDVVYWLKPCCGQTDAETQTATDSKFYTIIVKRIIGIMCAKNSKTCLNLLELFTEDCRSIFPNTVYMRHPAPQLYIPQVVGRAL